MSQKIKYWTPQSPAAIYQNQFANRVNSQRVDFPVSINKNQYNTTHSYYVPYTKRNTNLEWVSTATEKRAGDKLFEELKENKYKDMILPQTHPDNVRVRLIFQDLIGVFQRGSRREADDDALTNELNQGIKMDQQQSDGLQVPIIHLNELWEFLIENDPDYDGAYSLPGGKIDQQQTSNGIDDQEGGLQASITHLNELNWQVLVVNDPDDDRAYSIQGGKIVVHTNMLKRFQSDAELAIIIGHEVGHVVARHHVTQLIRDYVLDVLLQSFIKSNPVMRSLTRLSQSLYTLWTLSRSRKYELEADYIGMLLAASAGYDPRVAPKVYQHELFTRKRIELFSSHPCKNRRSQLLAEAQVMEEALALYHEKLRVSAN